MESKGIAGNGMLRGMLEYRLRSLKDLFSGKIKPMERRKKIFQKRTEILRTTKVVGMAPKGLSPGRYGRRAEAAVSSETVKVQGVYRPAWN